VWNFANVCRFRRCCRNLSLFLATVCSLSGLSRKVGSGSGPKLTKYATLLQIQARLYIKIRFENETIYKNVICQDITWWITARQEFLWKRSTTTRQPNQTSSLSKQVKLVLTLIINFTPEILGCFQFFCAILPWVLSGVPGLPGLGISCYLRFRFWMHSYICKNIF
jgi:hypothetical protein